MTEAAVSAFQKIVGLSMTGIADNETQVTLYQVNAPQKPQLNKDLAGLLDSIPSNFDTNKLYVAYYDSIDDFCNNTTVSRNTINEGDYVFQLDFLEIDGKTQLAMSDGNYYMCIFFDSKGQLDYAVNALLLRCKLLKMIPDLMDEASRNGKKFSVLRAVHATEARVGKEIASVASFENIIDLAISNNRDIIIKKYQSDIDLASALLALKGLDSVDTNHDGKLDYNEVFE